MSEFASPEEFQEVMDRIFKIMSEDPEMGPKLRAANIPQRFEFSDVDMVVNIRGAEQEGAQNLEWVWSDEIAWEPRVRMTMTSTTANRYFQGKENIAMALAFKKIKASGDLGKALELAPITKPIFARYSELVQAEYPHLSV